MALGIAIMAQQPTCHHQQALPQHSAPAQGGFWLMSDESTLSRVKAEWAAVRHRAEARRLSGLYCPVPTIKRD